MNGVAESGPTRPRPLSGGFWTLLSWLRGEEHASSNESISSAGSDRTAVSFAFLAPTHYRGSAAPIALPPQGPPTDSYRKRVHDRNIRRQYDRDTTLRRKYGLFRGDGVGFDVQTLPASRLTVLDADQSRERRATSECYQRRAAHVPGKRRAPPPPTRLDTNVKKPSSVIIRQHSRKRPAPQPPNKSVTSKESIIFNERQNNPQQMNQNSKHKEPFTSDSVTGCKSEKYTKKDNNNVKNCKTKQEKNFLKQIFETKKRNSSADSSALKLLPNISELDKQAAEIIAISKSKQTTDIIDQQKVSRSKHAEGDRHCIKCSKKYDKTNDICVQCNNKENGVTSITKSLSKSTTMYTQTGNELVNNLAGRKNHMEDKQKLKEMLKEMKDSLPKRTKHNMQDTNVIKDKQLLDTPTLRISSRSNKFEGNVAQVRTQLPNTSQPNKDNNTTEKSIVIKKENILHTPLKISSLLNPIYVPKINNSTYVQLPITSKLLTKEESDKREIHEPIYVRTADAVRDILLNSSVSSASKKVLDLKINEDTNPKILDDNLVTSAAKNNKESPKSKVINETDLNVLNIHARRRELVNQLEKSIATGNEIAAAEAAAKLAQLRLSCSVLSFTSHILEQPSTSKNSEKIFSPRTNDPSGIDVVPSSSATEYDKSKLELSNIVTKDKLIIENNKTNHLPVTIANKVVPNKSEEETRIQHVKIESSSNKSIARMKCDVATQSKNFKKSMLENHSRSAGGNINDNTNISIWVEDKEKAHGPISLTVRRQADVGELRRQAEQTLGIPSPLQRWIVGRELCTDDGARLLSLAGPNLDSPFYLCLVECDKSLEEKIRNTCKKKTNRSNIQPKSDDIANASNVYTELVKLESQASVPNAEPFECEICMEPCAAGEGVVLRECVHSFCRQCLSDVVRHCVEPTVSCPAMGCPGLLQEREIRALVNAEEYARWLDRGLAAAESGTRNAFHCRTSDCSGWALCETGARVFPCPVCNHNNCVPCQAIHEGETCEQYRQKLNQAANCNENQRDEGTNALIESLISRGEALQCPECNAVITKKWGCDWVKCSACKTEICWVTRGRRWGPAGRGDTSGGCRCGVDGKRCHPACGYCH